MGVNKLGVRHPTSKATLAFYSTTLKVHRDMLKTLRRAGYEITDDMEELADVNSGEEALAIAQHVMPINKETDQ